jgi:2,3-bisphosphoglycerate-dependent phosphoglycerate mutase
MELILVRHGQSTWNLENRFTGWVDVGLTDLGQKEAAEAGRLLAEEKLLPDVLHTSLLQRAITTAQVALSVCDRQWIPVRRHWRLNERHYGALQGLDKKEMVERHGPEQVHLWRRSYDVPPPALDPTDPQHPRHDPRYADLAPDLLPSTECLKDVVARMLPYWYDAIVPDLRRGARTLVVAHGNSLRALVKHLDGISDAEIAELNIPTGIPRLYRFDAGLKVIDRGYLGDPEKARAAAEAVKKQTAK